MEQQSQNTTKECSRIGEYYKNTVEPLLAAGNEDKLCEWLKKSGLISKQMLCNNEECQQHPMTWSKARVIDRFNWICAKCKKKVPIRHRTFFAELKCDFASIFTAINGWCSHKMLADITENKNYKIAVGKRIYTMCTSAAESYMKNHTEISILGGRTADGEDAVIIVDVYPDGSMTVQQHNNNNYMKRVLCIADTSYIPARVWAQLLEPADDGTLDFKTIKDAVIAHIKPNSTIVTSNILYPCVSNIPGFMEVININNLMIYDQAEHQRSLKNIETIWTTTVETCQQMQHMNPNAAEQALWELQWRQIFGIDPFRHILQHLVQYFNAQHASSAANSK